MLGPGFMLSARREITASGRLLVRRDGIVPLAVEIVTRDVDRLHLSFSDLEAFGVEVSIDLAAYFETCFGARRADELNDDLMTDQRLAPPVHGKANRRCSILFLPGGRWVTVIFRSASKRCSSRFHSLT